MRLVMLVLGVCCFSACAERAALPVLVIATDATFAPFHLLDEAGRPTGFDVELARAVAERAGFEPRIVVLPYEELFSGLTAGTHDLVAATTGVTPERERMYLFTRSYFRTCQAAVVRAGKDEPIALADLRNLRLGAAGSGTSQMAMNATPAAEHLRIADGAGAELLEAGEIDAWIVDEFDAVAAARGSGGRLRVLAEPVLPEAYAFVLASGREDLRSRLDLHLAELQKDGRIEDLARRFGVLRGPAWPVHW